MATASRPKGDLDRTGCAKVQQLLPGNRRGPGRLWRKPERRPGMRSFPVAWCLYFLPTLGLVSYDASGSVCNHDVERRFGNSTVDEATPGIRRGRRRLANDLVSER